MIIDKGFLWTTYFSFPYYQGCWCTALLNQASINQFTLIKKNFVSNALLYFIDKSTNNNKFIWLWMYMLIQIAKVYLWSRFKGKNNSIIISFINISSFMQNKELKVFILFLYWNLTTLMDESREHWVLA